MEIDSFGNSLGPPGQETELCQSSEYMIQCCICGIQMKSNPTATCSDCLKNQVDASEGIERNLVLPYCKHCERYQRPPWLACAWESRELLALCLKRLRGLQNNKRNIRLVDAKFLYTEPHSKRIKVKLTIQMEIVHNVIIEQDVPVEYILQSTQCDDCKRAFTPHTWVAIVQVRQRTEYKKSLMYLEQMILKNSAHEKVLKVVEANDGYDFLFNSKTEAQKFIEFASGKLPTKVKTSKQLVSHDSKSNTAFHKFTFSLDICPICKDDIILLPRQIANNIYGGISPFLLCSSVTSFIRLIDPFSLRGVDISSDKYWKFPFFSILTRRHLTEFIILNITPVDIRQINTVATAPRFLNKRKRNVLSEKSTKINNDINCLGKPQHTSLVDVEIAKATDFGKNDQQLIVRSHLGSLLHVGDWWLGYDLTTVNLPGTDDSDDIRQLPYDVILIRKLRRQEAKREWLLQRLMIERTTSSGNSAKVNINMDIEDLKEDIETDPVLRKEVNMWKDPNTNMIVDTKSNLLCDLLEGLTIDDMSNHIYE